MVGRWVKIYSGRQAENTKRFMELKSKDFLVHHLPRCMFKILNLFLLFCDYHYINNYWPKIYYFFGSWNLRNGNGPRKE